MPTIPPTSNESHHQRTVAESFGADAERYNRVRPSYPAALIDRILTRAAATAPASGPNTPAPGPATASASVAAGPSPLMGAADPSPLVDAAGPGPRVLDAGCGTGIAARLFQAAGCTVLGVDPDPRMAAEARRHGLEVEVAKIEDWDPTGRTFDVVAAGQTWHWVEPVAGAAKAAAALRPGGVLAVFWNGVEPPPEVAEATAGVFRRLLPDMPMLQRYSFGGNAYGALGDKAADGIRTAGGFGEPEAWSFPWERPYTRTEWVEQLSTSGFVNQLPPGTLADVLAGIGEAIADSFVVRYSTVAAVALREA
ncbi:class I SAM-dependent methyltransferase [Dactylosporangium sp. CA-233914]|uniref:class I SAM-dependent methyltransferase n=1 Tax=Dactylosporangium sp. CA-233914 TaxID=3239934 RepID=UPI003D8FA0D1